VDDVLILIENIPVIRCTAQKT